MGTSQHDNPEERRDSRSQDEVKRTSPRTERQERTRLAGRGRRYVPRRQEPTESEFYPPEPDRGRRASEAELGGLSEYQAKSAVGDSDEQDPIAEVRELALPHPVEEGDLTPPTMAVSSRKTGPPHEPETVLPEELGANYLRRAVQDPRPGNAKEVPPIDEELGASDSEQRLLETVSRSFAHRAGLVNHLPGQSDLESALSDLSRQAIHQARKAGARTHTQIRKAAGEYLARNAERLSRSYAADQRNAHGSDDEPPPEDE